MKQNSLSVLILTFNEQQHIERCINSVKDIADDIFIIDSYSTDKTVEIAKNMGAKVLQNKWQNNHAYQFNWGLENSNIKTEWVMRLDADEYITNELSLEIKNGLSTLSNKTSGVYMRRRTYFMGQWMKHGISYPIWVLRLWRYGDGHCENRWMDEHIVLTRGDSVRFQHDLIDDNHNDLTWWTNKHNHYATREAADLLNHKYNFMESDKHNLNNTEQAIIKRLIKENIWIKIPLFIRPFFYFLYRYILRLGFLNGWRGLQWDILQGFWYRFLVDAKIFEAENKIKDEKNKTDAIKKIVFEQWGLKPPE